MSKNPGTLRNLKYLVNTCLFPKYISKYVKYDRFWPIPIHVSKSPWTCVGMNCYVLTKIAVVNGCGLSSSHVDGWFPGPFPKVIPDILCARKTWYRSDPFNTLIPYMSNVYSIQIIYIYIYIVYTVYRLHMHMGYGIVHNTLLRNMTRSFHFHIPCIQPGQGGSALPQWNDGAAARLGWTPRVSSQRWGRGWNGDWSFFSRDAMGYYCDMWSNYRNTMGYRWI